jgi:uncharacterized repeat protein (TIGR03803 family)
MKKLQHRPGVLGIVFRSASFSLALAVVMLPAPPAQAQSFTVLYAFTGGMDGANPLAGLIQDAQGNFYGTTQAGGGSNCSDGCGTVFKLDTTGKQTVLYTFNGRPDGRNPSASLIRDAAGNFYGTAFSGGASKLGTVFKLDASGKQTVLHSFIGRDGANPAAGLIRDTQGNLYGTTQGGGAFHSGTVFKLKSSTGHVTVLHTFTGGVDGRRPAAGLMRDAAGNLYGTTIFGGASNAGTVFKLDVDGNETVLHSFGGTDGESPYAGLIGDAAGNLYGTTLYGGASFGTVFKLDAGGNETVLHTFTGAPDGASPSAGLISDATGNLYGTTGLGGLYGWGTVFKLDPAGNETVLHSFTSGEDGAVPWGGLIRDAQGGLYGTTYYGGAYGAGTVFKITP